ncbi:MAG: hypothetical protein GAK36_00214 [Pseudomonas sp.]|nr:MAG: hypothetical protein GAK36_00214 [Pseudomonas sp.]
MPDQDLSLAGLLDAIEQSLGEQLPEFPTSLRGPLSSVPASLPALALEYAELLPLADPGSGELALSCRCQVRLLVSPGDAAAEALALRNAARLAQWLRHQTWGLDVEPAQWLGIWPEVDSTLAADCRIWRVECLQPVRLGEPEWPWENQPPGSLLLGVDPQTGPGHEADYVAPEDLA